MSICYASDAPPAGHFHIFRQVVLPIYRPSRSRQRLIGDLLKPRVCPQPHSVYLSICPQRTGLSTPSISSRGSTSGWTRRLLVPRPDRCWVSRLGRRRRVCGAEGGPGREESAPPPALGCQMVGCKVSRVPSLACYLCLPGMNPAHGGALLSLQNNCEQV